MPELPDTFVRPDYGGDSIANLPATVGARLGIPGGWAGPGLTGDLPDATYDGVVLVLLDGLGWDRWRDGRDGPTRPLAERAAAFGGGAARIASVVPSTTSVATTTLLGDGTLPLEHGLLGYTARMPKLGLVANLLFWRPEGGPDRPSSLEDWGLVPERFLEHPSLFAALGRHGVRTRASMPAAIARSPLSRATMRGTDVAPYVNLEDALHGTAAWLRSADAPAFAYLYVPDLDTLSHRDGPAGAAGQASLAQIADRLGRWIDELAADGSGRRILVLITADHGHAATPREAAWILEPGDGIVAMLAAPPAGEARHAYLYARTGAAAELRAACAERAGASFAVLSGEAAIAAGLYGPPGRAHPEAAARIGDVVLLARDGATFWATAPDVHPLGMHGSLEPTEMHVPLVTVPVTRAA